MRGERNRATPVTATKLIMPRCRLICNTRSANGHGARPRARVVARRQRARCKYATDDAKTPNGSLNDATAALAAGGKKVGASLIRRRRRARAPLRRRLCYTGALEIRTHLAAKNYSGLINEQHLVGRAPRTVQKKTLAAHEDYGALTTAGPAAWRTRSRRRSVRNRKSAARQHSTRAYNVYA